METGGLMTNNTDFNKFLRHPDGTKLEEESFCNLFHVLQVEMPTSVLAEAAQS